MVTVMTEVSSGGQRRRSCNGTCHNAKKSKCVCICGGRYHGASRDDTLKQKLEDDSRPFIDAIEATVSSPIQLPLVL
jgi:hypothetical protein